MAKNGKALTIIGIIVGALLTAAIAAGSAVLAYGGKMYQVDELAKNYEKLESMCTLTKEESIGMKKDIEQILKTQKTMIETEKENTKSIIEAIGRVSGND